MGLKIPLARGTRNRRQPRVRRARRPHQFELFLNFGLRRFGAFAILRALSGEKEEVENYKRENGIICAMKGNAE